MIIAAVYRTVSTVYILITEKIQKKKKTLKAPTPQNGHTQTIRRQIGDELFECV